MSAGESKKRGFGDIVAVWALETRNVLGSDHLSLPSQDSGGAAGQGEEEEEDKEHKVDKVDRSLGGMQTNSWNHLCPGAVRAVQPGGARLVQNTNTTINC